MFKDKIDAIKAVRLAHPAEGHYRKVNEENGDVRFVKLGSSASTLSLKECKDLVESIMALGVKYYLEAELEKLKASTVQNPTSDIRF